MNEVSISYTLEFELSNESKYKFTSCGKCFNTKTNRRIKQVYNSGCLGYNINGKFKSLTVLRKLLVKIKVPDYPF